MSEAKFTKGPWKWSDHCFDQLNGHEYPVIDHLKYEGSYLYYCPADGEREANAHLIAAAPEMYSMLDKFKKTLLETDYDDYALWDLYDEFENVIKKARGEK